VTTQDVDPETYYAVGNGLFEKAGKLYDAFNVNVGILGGTGAMAGTDDAGMAWATSYDERVVEVLGAVNDLTQAMENYGGVVIQAGYNHAVAEHNATPGNKGPAPTKPPEPTSVAGVLTAPPSAGGPGRGLVDAIGLMQQVGVPVPDGDTDKVSQAADAWDRLATVYQTKTIAEALEVDARAFRDTQSPEVEYIVRDLEELRDAMASVTDGCAELSQSCQEYRSALGDLRDQLEGILEDLAIELAVTAAVAIAASFVSFGVGAVAGTAKAAQAITKYGRIIAEAVGVWKISKNISKGVKRVHDIAGLRQKLQRLKNLGRKTKPEERPKPLPRTDPEFDFNTRPERLDHTFADKHKLDGVVERAGGREEAMRQMLDGLKGRVPNQGTFETVIDVSGENVTVRGFVDNGVIKISTAFIP
jgi:hypothetical protein